MLELARFLDPLGNDAEVERLTTELIDLFPNESPPLVVKGLVIRSAARRLLGRIDEADTDLATARNLQSDDIYLRQSRLL